MGYVPPRIGLDGQLLLIGCTVVIALRTSLARRGSLQRVVLGVLAAHLLSAVLVVFLAERDHGSALLTETSDDAVFYMGGQAIREAWPVSRSVTQAISDTVGWGHSPLWYVVIAISLASGAGVLGILFLNSIAAALAALLAAKIALAITSGDNSIARRSALFVGFLPSLHLYSASLFRDAWIAVAVLTATLGGMELARRRRLRGLVLGAFGCGLVWGLRPGLAVAVAAVILVAGFVGDARTGERAAVGVAKRAGMSKVRLAMALVALAFAAVPILSGSEAKIARSQRFISEASEEGTGSTALISGGLGALASIPLALITPVPVWKSFASSYLQLLVGISSVIWSITLLPAAGFGMRKMWRGRNVCCGSFVAIAGIIAVCLLGASVSFFGLISRYRLPVEVLGATVAGIAKPRWGKCIALGVAGYGLVHADYLLIFPPQLLTIAALTSSMMAVLVTGLLTARGRSGVR